MRTIQCFRRAVLPVDRLLAYVFTAWSRTARSLGATDWKSVLQRVRRTSSPSYKAYRWINGRDGLEVRRTRRSKRKLAAKPQATAFLRVQTSDSTKDSIEIKLPSGISIMVPVSAVESIAAILEQVEKLVDCPRVFSITPRLPNPSPHRAGTVPGFVPSASSARKMGLRPVCGGA